MLDSPKLQHALKALLLIGLALFLYSRIANGTLNYYIAQRFAVFTLVAIVGLLLVGISYHRGKSEETSHDHEHKHGENEHAEHDHDHTAHEHALTWGGALLVALPIMLGLFVPPRPLGAAALSNREVNITSKGSTMPAALRAANQKSALDKNILDWTQLFQSAPDASTRFAGESAKVIGFVFRDERFNDEQFLVTRFIVSCCAADGNVVGLVVQWPQAAELPTDQWVEVTGVLSAGTLGDEAIPVLTAQSINKVPVPESTLPLPVTQSTTSSFKFDRIVGVVVILLLLAVLGLIWQTQGKVPIASTTPENANNQQYIVYTAVDAEGLEQLFATPIDLQTSSIITSVPMQLSHEKVGVWDFAAAPTGDQIVYSALTSKGTADLWLTTPLSTTAVLLASCPDGACGSAAWSPDGRSLAYSRRNASGGGAPSLNPPRLWMMDTLSGEAATVFSDTQKLAFEPRWSSDGQWLSYLSPDYVGVGVINLNNGSTQFFATPTGEPAIWRPGHSELLLTTLAQITATWVTHLVLVDVTTDARRNLSGEQLLVEDSSPVWTPDGAWIIFRRRIIEGAGTTLSKQLWRMRGDGSDAQPLTGDPDFEHGFVSISPAGDAVVFHKFPLKGPNLVLSVWVLNIETKAQIEVATPGQRPQWLP